MEFGITRADHLVPPRVLTGRFPLQSSAYSSMVKPAQRALDRKE